QDPRLPMPRRPAPAPWPLLAVDPLRLRQDHHSASERIPGPPLPGMDRQPPPPLRNRCRDGKGRRAGGGTPAATDRSPTRRETVDLTTRRIPRAPTVLLGGLPGEVISRWGVAQRSLSGDAATRRRRA